MQKKNKNAFEFPAKTRVNTVSNITILGSLDSWHQDLEFGLRMDIFGPVEPELWRFEVFSKKILKNIPYGERVQMDRLVLAPVTAFFPFK